MPNENKKRSPVKIAIWCLILVAIVVLAVFVLLRGNRTNQYTEETAKRQTIETYYTFTGNVEPMDSQHVVSTMNLSVKQFHVREGDTVQVGDILFDLDDRAITSNIEQITASLEIAKINYESTQGLSKDQQTIQVNNALASAQLSHTNASNAYNNALENLERMTVLHEADVIAKAELDGAQNSLDLAKSNLDSAALALNAAQKNQDNLSTTINQSIRVAQEQLNQAQASYDNILRQKNDLSVKAEVSGEIVEIYVTENETLIMGTQIMDIIDYDKLKISIRVDEYDLPAVTLEKEVEVRINALDRTVSGTVDSIAREAIPLANIAYFPTSVKIDRDPLIRVGLSAEVRVLNQRSEDTITLSMKALRFDNENKAYVNLKDAQGRPEIRYVTVGINDASTVEILEGVSEGDVVLITRNSFVPMGPMARGRN